MQFFNQLRTRHPPTAEPRYNISDARMEKKKNNRYKTPNLIDTIHYTILVYHEYYTRLRDESTYSRGPEIRAPSSMRHRVLHASVRGFHKRN